MSRELLERANRLYGQEGGSLERLLAQDPTYAALRHRLERAEARLAGGPGTGQAQALREARGLLAEMDREAAFLLGYLLAQGEPLE